MPFSLSVKEELSKIAPSSRFAALCEIAAILNFSKSSNKSNCLIYSEHIGTINFLIDYLQMEIDSVFPLKLIKVKNIKRPAALHIFFVLKATGIFAP